MPASAEVLEHNEVLRALVNSNPEGAGWFYKVKLSNSAELGGLINAASYQTG
jgi:glycine cleavage system H protein